MGWLSDRWAAGTGAIQDLGKAIEKPFRTGATAAARDAKAAGEVTLDEQQDLGAQIGNIYDPTIQAGNQAFGEIADFYSGNQQPIIDRAKASPFMSQLVEGGESRIAKHGQMTGGFRSGTTQENLDKNYSTVLMNLVNQQLQGQQGVANAGFGATDAYTAAMQNIVAGQGATRGQIANVDIAKAANKQNMIGGIVQGGLTALASDKALKKNIVQTGEKNNLPWYSWDWNELAKDIGLTGSDEGHIAQEVQKVRPDLVVTQNGYLAVNYGGF